MKTQERINELLKASMTRGLARESLKELFEKGIARTGRSNRYGKKVWTNEVVTACANLGLIVTWGNDAPRGGANGEYVMILDTPKNDIIIKFIAMNNRLEKIKKVREERLTKERSEELNKTDALIDSLSDDYLYSLKEKLLERNSRRQRDYCIMALYKLGAKSVSCQQGRRLQWTILAKTKFQWHPKKHKNLKS